ncbi:MAG: ATP-binding cassette domain-containing protein, partial [Lachnospiraceae bacterium]|nr:ATP-binding cassette domain-containing protein [Lachnospiraceae bacterium]
MPFFGKKNIAKVYTSKNNKPSLWDRNPVFLNLIKYTNLLSCPKKRVSSFISYQSYKATMTLEAALVMPCFLFAMLGLISIMDVMKIKGCMDVAVAEVGNNLAIETYGESINEFRTSFYIQRKINSFLKNNLSETEARSKLAKYDFRQENTFKRIGKLSGGEKVRIILMKLIQKDINFLILDE